MLLKSFRLTTNLVLIPVRLTLFGLVTLEIDIGVKTFTKTLYKKKLWFFETKKITKDIIHITTKEPDDSPPVISPVVQSGGVSNSTVFLCSIVYLEEVVFSCTSWNKLAVHRWITCDRLSTMMPS